MPAADRNALVHIMHDFGCPLYDPQLNQRYDAADGTAIGDTPPFEDPTSEQKAQMEKIRADMMTMFSGQKQKRGCAGAAVFFVAAIAALVWATLPRLGSGR